MLRLQPVYQSRPLSMQAWCRAGMNRVSSWLSVLSCFLEVVNVACSSGELFSLTSPCLVSQSHLWTHRATARLSCTPGDNRW